MCGLCSCTGIMHMHDVYIPQAIQEQYSKNDCKEVTHFDIQFGANSNEICLDIKTGGIDVAGGCWKILPLSSLVVMK